MIRPSKCRASQPTGLLVDGHADVGMEGAGRVAHQGRQPDDGVGPAELGRERLRAGGHRRRRNRRASGRPPRREGRRRRASRDRARPTGRSPRRRRSRRRPPPGSSWGLQLGSFIYPQAGYVNAVPSILAPRQGRTEMRPHPRTPGNQSRRFPRRKSDGSPSATGVFGAPSPSGPAERPVTFQSAE